MRGRRDNSDLGKGGGQAVQGELGVGEGMLVRGDCV